MTASLPFTVIIPARYASTRLPGKTLLDIGGKAMVMHVYARARQSGASRVIIATDDERIADLARREGAEACMTADTHATGTDRLAEVVEHLGFLDNEIVLNVQGDEPLISPDAILQVASGVNRSGAFISTLCTPITRVEELSNPSVVKVVLDKDGFALYFSRAPIPWDRNAFGQSGNSELSGSIYYQHMGLYGYRTNDLKAFTRLAPSPLEKLESLEQLRALWHGKRIHVGVTPLYQGVSVDTDQDLEKARRLVGARVL